MTTNEFDRDMTAATFAEAGELETARKILAGDGQKKQAPIPVKKKPVMGMVFFWRSVPGAVCRPADQSEAGDGSLHQGRGLYRLAHPDGVSVFVHPRGLCQQSAERARARSKETLITFTPICAYKEN